MFFEMREDDHLTYLIFKEILTEKDATYLIENNLDSADIEIY